MSGCLESAVMFRWVVYVEVKPGPNVLHDTIVMSQDDHCYSLYCSVVLIL